MAVYLRGGKFEVSMARRKKENAVYPPQDDGEWEAVFTSLSDEEQLAEARLCRDALAQLIADGGDYPSEMVTSLDEAITKYEKAIEAERIATERSRIAHEKLDRTADLLLALLPENERLTVFVPPIPARGKKGN